MATISPPTSEKEALVNLMVQVVGAKIYLAVRYIDTQFLWIKDMITDHRLKAKINRALHGTGPFLHFIEDRKIKTGNEDEAETYAGEDVELLGKIIDVLIEAESKGVMWKFKNDFYRICAENKLKI